eukprot:scaffold1572_cov329-Prasinococcus_capsulatus_cf.AAC.1
MGRRASARTARVLSTLRLPRMLSLFVAAASTKNAARPVARPRRIGSGSPRAEERPPGGQARRCRESRATATSRARRFAVTRAHAACAARVDRPGLL